MSDAEVAAIVVAAGVSARMGEDDKMFAPLVDRPLLAHTLSPFQDCASIDRVVLVVRSGVQDRVRRLLSDYGLDKVVTCLGGPRRQDSVRCGLASVNGAQWLIVHDGARPMVDVQLIERGLSAARESGAAIAAVPMVDTIKQVDGQGRVTATLDRSVLWSIQTPQIFRFDLLRKAHDEVASDVTDDAAMVEGLGCCDITLFMGSRLNLKVTTPEDLRLAEALLRAHPITSRG